MQENNLIKSITQHSCPHCKGEIYIESEMVPPTVSSIYTNDDVEAAKRECLERVTLLNIDEEKKSEVAKWINNPETIFGDSEIQSIIDSLQEQSV